MQKLIKRVPISSDLITECLKKMKAVALQGNFIAKQELNGVIVLVEGNSDVDLLFRDQQRVQSGYINSPIGPHPKAELSADDIFNDQRFREAIKASIEMERLKGKVI